MPKLRSRTAPVPAVGGSRGGTDAEVIAGSLDDPERFAVIFDRHADVIHRYAARRLGRQAAADVVSEVFLAAFRNRGRYQPSRTDARPWLYGIATKVISQQLRADGRRAHLLAAVAAASPAEFAADDIGDRIDAQRLHQVLLGVLAGLSPGDRELVLLVAWAELRVPHAATIAGTAGIGVAACVPGSINKGSMPGFHSCAYRTELIFDARTRELIGVDYLAARGSPALDGRPSSALLSIAVVSRIGQLP